MIIVIIVCWRIDSFIFFAKKAIYSLRATKLAFNSSKLVVETPKVPNLLKVSNKNVQLSKCPNIFFSGTSVANFEHIFAFRVKHLTVTYAYFFTTEWIFKPARIVLNHAWYQYSPCILRFIKKLNQLIQCKVCNYGRNTWTTWEKLYQETDFRPLKNGGIENLVVC